MRKYKIGIVSACILLFFGLYARLLAGTERLGECAERALFLSDRPVSGAQAEQLQKQEEAREEPQEFALWEQKSDIIARNENLQRRHTASLLLVSGSSELVLSGNRLEAWDADGCLLDERTALELFGSVRAEGLAVTVDGRKKVVRGILRGAQDTVLCRAGEEDALTHLSLRIKNGGASQKVLQEFTVRHGLAGRAVRVEILYELAALPCFLIPVLACFWLLLGGLRMAWRKRGESGGLLWLAAFLGGLWLLAWRASCHVRLPEGLAPTKWSDFAFWKNWWAQTRGSILLLLLTEKQKPMQIWAEEFSRVCAYGAFSFFLLLFLGRYCYNTSWSKQDVVKRDRENGKENNL